MVTLYYRFRHFRYKSGKNYPSLNGLYLELVNHSPYKINVSVAERYKICSMSEGWSLIDQLREMYYNRNTPVTFVRYE